MKKFMFTSILALLAVTWSTVGAQEYPDEYLGLPGDNLNLYGVMKLFQESETLEGFERNLNDENSRINNLDLNGDNLVDYIMVNDYVDGDVHSVVLRVALDQNETQDVAVFTVQRFSNESVQIQLIGDEALYGRNYIVEPIYDDHYGETPNPGYTGKSGNSEDLNTAGTPVIEIGAWPLVKFIFLRDYVAWHTEWYWGYWPAYWYGWRPYYWHYYYGYHSHWYPEYYRQYRHWNHRRYSRYNDFYYSGIRSYSPLVSININKGNYKNTYSHPELRSDGEALYSRIHSGQDARASQRSASSVSERRNMNTSSDQNNGISRGTSGSDRVIADPSSGRERTTSQNKSATVNGGSGASSSVDQHEEASQRSATSVSGRRSTNTSADQTNTSGRSNSSVSSDKVVSKPSSGQKHVSSGRTSSASSGRSSVQKSSGAGSSSRNSGSGRTSGTGRSSRR